VSDTPKFDGALAEPQSWNRANSGPHAGLRQHKFGVPIAKARELYRKASSFAYLDPVGVSVHIGSQITDVRPFAETMERVLALVRELTEDGLNISFVAGGPELALFQLWGSASWWPIQAPLLGLSEKASGRCQFS